MSSSTTLLTFGSIQNDPTATSDLNQNFAAVNTALGNCIALNGQAPNQMQANFDMNSNRILNLPAPISISEPMRLADATTLNGGGTVTVSQLPIGGTVGQVLTKNSSTNFDVSWLTPSVNVTPGKSVSFTNSLTLAGIDGTTITFQGTDTYVGRATTDNFSNKTFNANVNGNVFQMFGNSILSLTGTGAMVLGTGPTINNMNWTGTVTGMPVLAGLNFISFSNLPQTNAFTLVGNTSNSTANMAGFTIGSLTQKGSPAAGDYVLIQDNSASGALKFATVSSVGTAGSVSSIAGNTGAFTLGAGITNSTNVLLVDPSYMRGYIGGLILSNDSGSPNTTIDISAGSCTSDDQSTLMKLGAFTKTTGSWAAGSNNGGLDTGTVNTSTWYHVFVIENTSTLTVDVLLSTSATSPTFPSGYTVKRRIGSFMTDGSAHILPFVQVYDDFLWKTEVEDVNAVPSTTASLKTLSVPLGVQVVAKYRAAVNTNSNVALLFTSPDENDQTPVVSTPWTSSLYGNSAVTAAAGEYQTRTNTSSQVRTRASNANGTLIMFTYGWRDFRGQGS